MQTHRHFSLVNPLPLANHGRHARSNRRPPNRPRPISPPGHTKISIMVTTSAPSVPRKLQDVRVVSGRAEHAGPSSILDASRSGQQTRAQQRHDNRLRTEKCLLPGNGVVRDAICPRIFCPRTSTAGVRKSLNHDQRLVYHPFLVARLVLAHDCFPNPAHTPVVRPAMPVLVRPVA